MVKLTPEKLGELLADAAVFRGYVSEIAEVNAAQREVDLNKRRELREKYVQRKVIGFPSDLAAHEIDLLFDLAANTLRSIVSKRSAAFSVLYGIEIDGVPKLEPSHD